MEKLLIISIGVSVILTVGVIIFISILFTNNKKSTEDKINSMISNSMKNINTSSLTVSGDILIGEEQVIRSTSDDLTNISSRVTVKGRELAVEGNIQIDGDGLCIKNTCINENELKALLTP